MSSHSVQRRRFLGACAAGAAVPLARAAAPRPNILYIHSHDTGRYLQPYGHAVPAPNLQRLAEGGVLFRKAFNAAPTCSPSRASLLTGMCPHSNGMLGLAHRGFSMADYRQHILHMLRSTGYHSALIGLQHIAADPKAIGYDQVESFRGNRTEDVAPAAAAFLSRAPAAPFFLDVGFFETHRVFRAPGPHEDARYCQPPAPIPAPICASRWITLLAEDRPGLHSFLVSQAILTTTPGADFCRPVRMDRSTLSPDSGTNGRSPEVISTAFRTQPPNLQPVPLMDMGFAVSCQLARHRMPQIRCLYIGSYVLLRASFRPSVARTPLRFAMTSPPSGCQGDFHPRAVEHARHTTNGRHPARP